MIVWLLAESIIIVTVLLWDIPHLYGFYLSEDELGYWGNAAYLLGRNWGNILETTPYYSYGYSMFLIPILMLPVRAIMSYRFAICLNAVLVLGSFFIGYRLSCKMFPEQKKEYLSIIMFCVTLYASNVAQASVAWAECCLMFFVWLIFSQAYRLLDQLTIPRLFVFLTELGFLYIVHQRTVGFVAAGILYVLLLLVQKYRKGKYVVLSLVILGVLFVGGVILKRWIQAGLYGGTVLGNDYQTILSGMTLKTLVKPTITEMIGQFYYLCVGTFGLAPLGLLWAVICVIDHWKEKNGVSIFYAFVIISFLGLLTVSSVYMRYSQARVDYLIYGRYIDIETGFLCMLGANYLRTLMKEKKKYIVILLGIGLVWGLTYITLWKIQRWDFDLGTMYHGICAPGTYYLYHLFGMDFKKWTILITVIYLVLFILYSIGSKYQAVAMVTLFLTTVVSVYSGSRVITYQINDYQGNTNQGVVEADKFYQMVVEKELPVVYLSQSVFCERGNIQMNMQPQPLTLVRSWEELDMTEDYCSREEDEMEGGRQLPYIVIVDQDGSMIPEELQEQYIFLQTLGANDVYQRFLY